MGLLVFAIIGLVVGLVVGYKMPEAPGGPPATGVIGLTGGLIGGIAGAALTGMDPVTQLWGVIAFIGALAGAIVVLALYALIAAPGQSAGMPTSSGDHTTGRGYN